MDAISICSVGILIVLCSYFLFRVIWIKDKSQIWSPMTTISITYVYYCIVPFFYSIDRYAIDENLHSGYIFHVAALVSFLSIIVGFQFGPTFRMTRWNSLYRESNTDYFALLLFIIALICYTPFRGFHITFVASEEQDEVQQLLTGGFIYYLLFAIDIMSAAVGLFLVKRKGLSSVWKLLPIWIVLSTFLYAGARWRIVVSTITALTVYHLLSERKRPNYILILALMVVLFFGFSIMDQSRQYGKGINMEKAQSLDFGEIKQGAGENYSVYMFSLLSMERLSETHTRYYFDPIYQAITMPIPRFLFPSKPNAEYIHDMERVVLGDQTGGAACLNFVEGYLSFGWFGIIIYGLLLGGLAKGIWRNYQENSASVGAVLLLGLFSGVCYCIISRGYLASTLTNVLYVVCLPFWICQLVNYFRKGLVS